MTDKLKAFSELVEAETMAMYNSRYPAITWRDGNWDVQIRQGKKYTKVDVGRSGKFMVVNETGEIFGIKAYGVIHRGHYYGTLDTINEWHWGDYHPVHKTEVQS